MAPLNADSIDFQITSPSPLHLLRRNVLELTELSEWDTREKARFQAFQISKPSKSPSLPNLQAFQIANLVELPRDARLQPLSSLNNCSTLDRSKLIVRLRRLFPQEILFELRQLAIARRTGAFW